jgi:hypothetical protein
MSEYFHTGHFPGEVCTSACGPIVSAGDLCVVLKRARVETKPYKGEGVTVHTLFGVYADWDYAKEDVERVTPAGVWSREGSVYIADNATYHLHWQPIQGRPTPAKP